MPTIDEDLNQLEKDVRQLKIEYEQYFGGGRKRHPTEIEWRIDSIIKKYGERGSNMKFAQRYRYGAIAQTYARYREVFRKRLKQKEEGTVVRHFGAAAKQIAAERATQHAAELRTPPVDSGASRRISVSYSGSDHQGAKTQKLYEAFRDAKQQAGENTNSLTLEAFQSFVQRKTDELRTTNKDAKVEFSVSVEDGKVKLKARADSAAKFKTKH